VPSLAEGIAALTAHVASGEVNAAKQYAVFPSFFFPVTRDSVASDGSPAAFDFVLRVNMIPSDAPEFALSSDFVWKIYGEILSDRTLPAADAQSGFARQFAEAKGTMGDGMLSREEIPYFETPVSPRDIETSNGWAPVALGPERIKALAAQLAPVHRHWLTRFNVLPELGDGFIESIHFEQLSLVVLRPWFDPAVFTWRFWDLPGQPISDGADLPRGRLPGLIGKIVLVRKLRMKLAAAALPPVPHIVFRRATPAGADGAAQPKPPMERLMALSGAEILRATPLVLRKPLRPGGEGLKAQIDRQRSELAREIGEGPMPSSAGGSQRFHVPFSFDVDGPRAASTAALQSARAAKAARQAERDQAISRIDALKSAIAKLDRTHAGAAGPFRFPMDLAITTQKNKLQLDMAALQAAIAQIETQIAQAQAEEVRWNQALEVLNQLQAVQADDTCYALALVCDRIAKSPDPDPSLFPRA
jgi:hypothetical protein